MRRTALLVAALICVLTAGAGPASAGVQNQFATFFVKFKFQASTSSGEKFSGKIDSNKGKCVEGRKVTVYRKKNGNKKKLGSDKTNDKGKFKVGVGDGPPKNGKYFAEVKESTFEADDGDRVTCRGETSGSVKIS
jgi:5-hydroxyisourate hydrolase-like protein (transthyretin family)